MPFISVDMTGVKDSYEPIAEGKVVLCLTKAEMKQTSDGSKQFVNWTAAVQRGPDTGKLCWIKTFLTDDARWVLNTLYTAITGIKVESLLVIDDPAELFGREFCAEITHKYVPVEDAETGMTVDKCIVNVNKFTQI